MAMAQTSVRKAPAAIARAAWLACVALAGAGCSEAVTTDPDQAELRNIYHVYGVPKSSPSQLVNTFSAVCVDGPASRADKEETLRDLSYVPVREWVPGESQLFVVDDRRPAVVLTQKMCMALAEARTGQSERFEDYVESSFKGARPLNAESFARNIERAWQVDAPRPGIVASQREPYQAITRYGLIFFSPGAT